MTTRFVLLGILAGLGGAAEVVSAQAVSESATVSATATVVATYSGVVARRPLELGANTLGFEAIGPASHAAAGAWHVSGPAGATVILGLSLPEELVAAAPLAPPLPIRFVAAIGALGEHLGNAENSGVLSELTLLMNARLGTGTEGALTVRIGGVVIPTAPGSYEGTASLTVSYP